MTHNDDAGLDHIRPNRLDVAKCSRMPVTLVSKRTNKRTSQINRTTTTTDVAAAAIVGLAIATDVATWNPAALNICSVTATLLLLVRVRSDVVSSE